jgi:hypothetical protein
MKKWKINLKGNGHGTVECDGQPINVVAITVVARVRKKPLITVTLFPESVDLQVEEP